VKPKKSGMKGRAASARFTDAQALFLCEALESQGWTVFEEIGICCVSCGEEQEIEWDFCPHCGASHAENPCERDTSKSEETIVLVRDLVQEAIDYA
jgi:hypothetical protein